MYPHKISLCIVLLFLSNHLFAASDQLDQAPDQPPGVADALLADLNEGTMTVAPGGFEENKGQVRTVGGEPAPFVRYRFVDGLTKIFLLPDGIAYQFEHPLNDGEKMKDRPDPRMHKGLSAEREKMRMETYRMDMVLEGADPNALITTAGRSTDYTNYYGQNSLEVHTYAQVTYHDVYPGIDWVIHTTTEGIKYDFVVHPGADPDRIRMRFKHQEQLELDGQGALLHGNRLGRFTEQAPVSLQDGRKVATRFVLVGDLLRFSLDAYDHTRTLTIDPDRKWATYYGGSFTEYGQSCAVDASGNVYLAGDAQSTANIASGGYQNTQAGGICAFLAKFTAAGVRLWGTYYGASMCNGTSCAVGLPDEVYLAGYTQADPTISTPSGHQVGFGGAQDAFLVKFNSAGVRQWATFYGASFIEIGWECAAGLTGVFLAGTTYTPSGASADTIADGGHQLTPGGSDDAFLVKFNRLSGNRVWGTYYGGTGTEQGTSCALGGEHVYLAGYTQSTGNIASGGQQNALGGGDDGFLASFDIHDGSRDWGTYCGGTSDDYGFSCATDGGYNVYLAGSSQSTINIATGGHQNFVGGLKDAFLVKYDQAGARQWGTYYGGVGNDDGLSCAARGQSVYLVGSTLSDNAISYGGHQDLRGGGKDAFLVKFNTSGVRQCATYYGGSSEDEGYGCAVDGTGRVYLAGTTSSANGIAFQGHQNTYDGGMFGHAEDAFLAKFFMCSALITSSPTGGFPSCSGVATNFAVPYTGNDTWSVDNDFSVELSDQNGFFALTPLVIGSLHSNVSGSILCTMPAGLPPGTGYRVRVVSSDPYVVGEENENDLVINPSPTVSVVAGGPTTFCEGGSVELTACCPPIEIPWEYMWAPMGQTTSSISATSSGTHSVTVTDSFGCSATSASVVVAVNPAPQVSIVADGPTTFCEGGSVNLTACCPPIEIPWEFEWASSGQTTSSISATSSGTHSVTVTDSFGCSATSASVVVAVTPSTAWYADADADGFGDLADAVQACDQPSGYVANSDDGCPNDPNKFTPGICGCGVADTDVDGDGLSDCVDNCPNVPGVIGSPCDDGNANTQNDVIGSACTCTGTPVVCNANAVTLTLTTDAQAAQTSWDIVNTGTTVAVCTGNGYVSSGTITAPCCLPNGCYDLRVFDSAGDGLSTGGYVLRDAGNSRLIDNEGNGNTFTATSISPLGFCVPMGTDALQTTSCDLANATSSTVLRAVLNTAVTAAYSPGTPTANANTGYQFWVTNPNGGFSRRIQFTHAAPGTGWPTGTPVSQRASFFQLSTMSSAPVIPPGILLNVRVRSRLNGVYSEFGPACRLLLPVPACQTTGLTTTASPVTSCGATGLTLASTIYATPVTGATGYQFEFSKAGYLRRITLATRSVALNFVTSPLLNNNCYAVRVRTTMDGGSTYCPFGPSCTITIGTALCGSAMDLEPDDGIADVGAHFSVWPNPNDGSALHLMLTGYETEVNSVGVDVMDVYGKLVTTRTIPVPSVGSGGYLNTEMAFDQELAPGLYLVYLQVGEERFTERLVIQR